MEDIKTETKKDIKSNNKLNKLFEDKKKRYLYMFLFILPFVVLIGVFGFLSYKEVKSLLSLATGEEEVKDTSHLVEQMGLALRENATDVQLEYFTELKNAVEGGTATEEEIIGLVAKNYIADFYTWSNKQGQYDVGGMQYVCSEKNEVVNYRENVYIKARDGFYKYLNEYIKKYGKENLLEVESVNVVNVSKADYIYYLHEYTGSELLEDGETVQSIYENVEHDCYDVKVNWTYKQNDKFSPSSYATSINLLVIENDGKYEIVEASEKTIDARESEEDE